MSTDSRGCAAVEAILSEARPLEPGEADQVARHLERCPRCRATRALVALLDFDREGAPGPDLDDVARRRLLLGALETAKSREGAARSSAQRPARRRGLIVAAGIAAGLLLLGAGLWVHRVGSSTEQRASSAFSSLDSQLGQAQVLMSSGAVFANGKEPSLGRHIAPGKTVETRRGTAALRLADSVVCLLADGSRIEIRETSEARVRLDLLQGTLYLTVRHQAVPRIQVIIVTPQGQVEVMGTVLAVHADPGSSSVSVARGIVRAVHGKGSLQVRRGETYVLGAEAATRLSAEAQARLSPRLDQLRLLGRAGDATLQVDSEPQGAEVSLDGVLLGVTPLQARIPVEDATLRITTPGHLAVTELLHVRPGQRIQRDYDLARLAVGEVPRRMATADTASNDQTRPEAAPRPAQGRLPPPGAPHGLPQPPASSKAPSAGPAAARSLSLMQEAQQRRLARDFPGAVKAYQEIIDHYPGQSIAAVARVSIATIELDHLAQPAKALKGFDQYLKGRPTGALAEEAAFGRIRALRALGQACEELRAARDFARTYPGALHRARVLARAKALETSVARACDPR